jgi:pyruvate,orthophosphate dikinase
MANIVTREDIQSEALIKNMDLTKVEVVISDRFAILQEAVKGFAGKEQQAGELVVEYHHRYRNWQFVVQETWRYAVSNLRLYKNQPFNGCVVYLLSYILLEALTTSEREEVRNLAADHLIAFWQKLVDEMPEELARPIPDDVMLEDLDHLIEESPACHQGVVRFLLSRLIELAPESFDPLMRSYYQFKRLARKLLGIWSDPGSFVEVRALLHTMLKRTYEFWLERDDPCKWLAQQWGAGSGRNSWYNPCSPLSHEQYAGYLHALTDGMAQEPDNREAVSKMVGLPDFHGR